MIKDKKAIIACYEDRYARYGYDIRTIGWGDTASQKLRFEVLSSVGYLSSASVCDVGCGFGDLYSFLVNKYGSVKYWGIDLSPNLIAEAIRRHPGVGFEVRDILVSPFKKSFDYVLCSGALSFKIKNHKAYVADMIESMYTMSNKGVAVNFLSTYVDYQQDKDFHFSPEQALALGKKLSKYVRIAHDYPLYEFTLFIYRLANNYGKDPI